MKRHLLQILIAIFVVLAASQSLLPTTSTGFGQEASAGPPPTPAPVKSTPDTSVPATSGTTPRPQSFVPNVGPGAVRTGFDDLVLNPNDDGSTGLVNIGFPINFFGTTYTSLYVNNNGNVTFSDPLGTYTPFNIVTTGTVIIAPFFADVDTRSAGQPTRYGSGTAEGRPAFGASWRDVDYYQSSTTHTNRNYFQLVLVDRSDVGAGDFDIEFNYDQVQWEAGTASDGNTSGLGGSAARAGYSNGAAAAFELPGSGVNGAFLDGNSATGLALHSFNSNQTGRYVYGVRGGYTPAALTTDTVNLNSGTDIDASVTVQNVPGVGLGSYSLVVNFDPSVVTVNSVGDGDAPFGAPTTQTIDNTAGTVTLAGAQTGLNPSGTIVLARLGLHGAGNGSSTLDVTGQTLTAVGGAPLVHVVTPGVATVTTPVVTIGPGLVLVGSSIGIPVSVQGLINQSLKGYDITVTFDHTKIAVNSVSGGTAPFAIPASTIDNTAGTVTFSQIAAGGFPTGNVLLANLNIQGLAEGAGNVAIAVTGLTNSESAPITNTTDAGAVIVHLPSTLHHIIVTPANPSLPVAGSQDFTAQGFDQYDTLMEGLTFAWTSANATAGSIDGTTGAFTAGTVAGGYPNVIVATSGAVTGTASVIVTPGPLHHIIVSPANPSVETGANEGFTAQGYDQYDNPRPGEVFGWSVTDATAGSIGPATGLFTAGTTTGAYEDVIQATSGAVTGTASVTVVAPHIRLRGDVNDDGTVDILDLAAVAAAFHSAPGSPNWNADADLDLNENVNVLDLVVVGLNFGANS